jgi:ADP-ribose 1''-phosphate phosphatase
MSICHVILSTMSNSKLVYVEGDLFVAPDHSILVHACNTLGSWGSGIALTFREKYPAQFAQYQAHCKTHGQALVGTCLLIPGDKHDIACLFTSRAYGKDKDKPAEILAATRKAMIDLEAKNVDNKGLHAW